MTGVYLTAGGGVGMGDIGSDWIALAGLEVVGGPAAGEP
jgi:hypothetical protein